MEFFSFLIATASYQLQRGYEINQKCNLKDNLCFLELKVHYLFILKNKILFRSNFIFWNLFSVINGDLFKVKHASFKMTCIKQNSNYIHIGLFCLCTHWYEDDIDKSMICVRKEGDCIDFQQFVCDWGNHKVRRPRGTSCQGNIDWINAIYLLHLILIYPWLFVNISQ